VVATINWSFGIAGAASGPNNRMASRAWMRVARSRSSSWEIQYVTG